MATVEGLGKVGQLVSQGVEQTQGLANQAAAQKAVELYKQGDIRGAYGTLMQADPAFAQKIAPQLTQIDPELAGQLTQSKEEGQLGGQTKFGSNPNQIHTMDNANALEIAKINAAAHVKAAQAKNDANEWTVRSDPTSPTGFSRVSKRSGEKQFINLQGEPIGGAETPAQAAPKQATAQPGQSTTQPVDPNAKPQAPGQQPAEAPPKPALIPGAKDPNSKATNAFIDSNGKSVLLAPNQMKALDTSAKEFDKETKDLTKAINDGHQALQFIQKNNAGTQTVEKLRLLKSVVSGRINQQEFAAFGTGNGILANIENAISEASGKGMGPQVQNNMLRLAKVALDLTTKEYDQALKNRVERTASQGIDPLIVKRRLIGSGPTPYQDALKQIETLPPQAQGLYSWVHDNIDSKDPAVRAQAQKYQQSLQKKYGF
jgi:hypothetical protein